MGAGSVGGERPVDGGEAHGRGLEPVVVPEGDVHRPVDATRLAVFTSAVERIHDPDAVGVEAAGVFLALFGEHGVVRSVGCEFGRQELLGGCVAGVLDVPRRRTGGEHLLAQFEENMPGLRRQSGGELSIGLLR